MNETARKALELSRDRHLDLWRHVKQDVLLHEAALTEARQNVRLHEDAMAELTAALGDGWEPSEERTSGLQHYPGTRVFVDGPFTVSDISKQLAETGQAVATDTDGNVYHFVSAFETTEPDWASEDDE